MSTRWGEGMGEGGGIPGTMSGLEGEGCVGISGPMSGGGYSRFHILGGGGRGGGVANLFTGDTH